MAEILDDEQGKYTKIIVSEPEYVSELRSPEALNSCQIIRNLVELSSRESLKFENNRILLGAHSFMHSQGETTERGDDQIVSINTFSDIIKIGEVENSCNILMKSYFDREMTETEWSYVVVSFQEQQGKPKGNFSLSLPQTKGVIPRIIFEKNIDATFYELYKKNPIGFIKDLEEYFERLDLEKIKNLPQDRILREAREAAKPIGLNSKVFSELEELLGNSGIEDL